MVDFISSFAAFEESLRSAAGNVMSKLDHFTFKMLINNLKSTDYQAVMETLEQLEKEKRPISIPPIYFLSTSHPDNRIRVRAGKALGVIDPHGEASQLVKDKDAKEAVGILIQKYGNFRG